MCIRDSRATVRALLDTEAYRRDVVERAARFERRYPTLIKTGFCLSLIHL